MLRRLRQIVQISFLMIFTSLLVKAIFGRVIGSWVPLLIMALTTALLTLVLGRVWCGWACPVNTVLDRVHFKGTIERGARLSDRWRAVKYLLLFLIVVAAFLSTLPPASSLGISHTQSPKQNLYIGIGIGGLTLAVIIGLEAITEHFWCRYLCPLGGAVAILSKIAPMRRIVRVHCNDCSVCVDACPTGTIDPRRGFESNPSECTVCLDCMTSCTSSSNGFAFLQPELFNRRPSTAKSGLTPLRGQR